MTWRGNSAMSSVKTWYKFSRPMWPNCGRGRTLADTHGAGAWVATGRRPWPARGPTHAGTHRYSPAGPSRTKSRAYEEAGAARMGLVRRMADDRRQEGMHGNHDTPASASGGKETPTPGDTALDSALGELVKVLARKSRAAAGHDPRRTEAAGRGGLEDGPAYTDDGASYRTQRARDGGKGATRAR